MPAGKLVCRTLPVGALREREENPFVGRFADGAEG